VFVGLSLLLLGALVVSAGVSCQAGGNIGGSEGGGGGGGNKGGKGGGGNAGGGGIVINLDAPTIIPPSSVTCGNGEEDPNEQCDIGPDVGQEGSGCTKTCQVVDGFECPEFGKPCHLVARCGDGQLTSTETCDDGNTVSGDGCSADCSTVEDGYQCRVPGRKCNPLCGDSKLIGSEQCDDGNSTSNDGCSSNCQLEPGATCPELGKPCTKAQCGNGQRESGELCDCGTDPGKLPSECKAVNGLFYGDPKNPGCSKTCTKEPNCQDSSGKTQACTTSCGDGNKDPGEDCDDGNGNDGDGCSKDCKVEAGFTCSTETRQDSETCKTASGQCLEMPIIYRDFQPENASSGGHPDFPFLGTRYNSSKSSTTVCVPNSGGPAKGNDSTTRCWGIMASSLLRGKPQPGTTTTCSCQFSDWSIGNASHIPSGYTQANNDSPLNNGNGGYLGGDTGAAVTTTSTGGAYNGTIKGYTSSDPGGPIFAGTVPAYKNADSFKQWFNDDSSVNKTFVSVLEMPLIGSNIYQYASTSHLAQGGFFPLDTLNSSQATLCNLWPYWNHYSGTPIWSTCTGDQYLFPPRVVQSDCPNQNPLSNGCWVSSVAGVKHDSYFTDEARYYFVYDGSTGITLSFYGDDDLFIFINGVLVLDLGGVHQQLPGKVTVTGDNADAQVIEGGCLDSGGNITGYTAGSTACTPTNGTWPSAKENDDYRVHPVKLGLASGKVYEIAIFGADRHPPESNYQLTLQGFSTKKSACKPHCGDGKVTAGEQCDCGDGSVDVPKDCLGKNDDNLYGGCTTKCTYGPFCGDEKVQTDNGGKEECDIGKKNGENLGKDGCTIGCMKPHFCGDGITDTNLKEECDFGENNGKKLDREGNPSDAEDAFVHCLPDCSFPPGIVF
jgi:fibro-slime domain-containing protein